MSVVPHTGRRLLLSSFPDADLREAATEALGMVFAADPEEPVTVEMRAMLLAAADMAISELDRRRRVAGGIYDVDLLRLAGGVA
jgi:hypothetical protein